MKFWRRLITGSMMALSLASCAGEKSPTQIYNQIDNSVVLIRHEDGHGTGFFIPGRKGFCTVLTVNHVLPPQNNYRLDFQDKPIPYDLTIHRLKSLDLAAVTFRPDRGNCPYKSIPLGDSDGVQPGQEIHVLGYPADRSILDSHFVSGKVTAVTAPKAEGYAIAV